MRPTRAKWGTTGQNSAKWALTRPDGTKLGQTGPNKENRPRQEQTGLNRVKWGKSQTGLTPLLAGGEGVKTHFFFKLL